MGMLWFLFSPICCPVVTVLVYCVLPRSPWKLDIIGSRCTALFFLKIKNSELETQLASRILDTGL